MEGFSVKGSHACVKFGVVDDVTNNSFPSSTLIEFGKSIKTHEIIFIVRSFHVYLFRVHFIFFFIKSSDEFELFHFRIVYKKYEYRVF